MECFLRSEIALFLLKSFSMIWDMIQTKKSMVMISEEGSTKFVNFITPGVRVLVWQTRETGGPAKL